MVVPLEARSHRPGQPDSIRNSAYRPRRRAWLGSAVIDDFDELVALVEWKPRMYLRYSAGPAADAENGPSRDHEAEVDLPGSAAE